MNKKKTSKKQLNNVMVDDDYNDDDLAISNSLNFAKGMKFKVSQYVEKVEEPKQLNKSDIHKGHRQRMYDRYYKTGFNGFQEHEVLEMLLYTAYPRGDTNEIAHELINAFGGLEYVLGADFDDLVNFGLKPRVAVILSQFHQTQNYIRLNKFKNLPILNIDEAGRFCCENFGYDVVESFYVICLGQNQKVVNVVKISTGDERHTEAYPSRVLRVAMRNRATAVILCHNHPGGDLNPSNDDIICTNRIAALLDNADIPLKDHIICCGERYTSLFERGSILI